MTPTPDLLRELAAAIDALTGALAGGRAEAVLAAEPALAQAVARLNAATVQPADRHACWAGVLAVRQALGRARRLGDVGADLQAAFAPQPGYTAAGRPARRAAATVHTRA